MTQSVHWAAIAAALVCASCAGPPTETKREPRSPSAPNLQEVTAKVPAAIKTTTPQDRAPRPRITSAALIGLADNALARLMGAPGFKRIDDPAALWQYRGTGCILDIFLYADGPVYRVTHFEFRQAGPGGRPMNGRTAKICFSGLLPGAPVKG